MIPMNNTHISEPTASDLFLAAFLELGVRGKEVVLPKARTIEILFPRLVLTNPRHRWMLIPERKMNTFASCVETLWVLSGSKEIKFLLPVLPRAADFSDDGSVWRAGYGPRLFSYGPLGINQLDYCLRTLQKDPTSRQAVISLWDPSKETTVSSSKDFPCSNHLQFLIRDDDQGVSRLHLRLVIRSNDLVWGFSAINLIEFTVIQEIMAESLGVSLGNYYHDPGSLHVYPDKLRIPLSAGLDLMSRYYHRFPTEFETATVDHTSRISSFDHLRRIARNFLEHWLRAWPEESGGCGEKLNPIWIEENVLKGTPSIFRDLVLAACSALPPSSTDWGSRIFGTDWKSRISDSNLISSLSMSWTPFKKN